MDEARDRVDHMLAVVHDNDQFSGRDVIEHGLHELDTGSNRGTQRCCRSVGNTVGVLYRCQVDEPRAVGEH